MAARKSTATAPTMVSARCRRVAMGMSLRRVRVSCSQPPSYGSSRRGSVLSSVSGFAGCCSFERGHPVTHRLFQKGFP